MVDLTLDQPGDHLYVRSVSEKGFYVDETWHGGSVVLSRDTLVEAWPPLRPDEITAAHLETLLELEPEVVLLGTGPTQVFLPVPVLSEFFRRGIGVEMMDTRAACRTFNVLVSEERRVVAGFLPIAPEEPAQGGSTS